MKLKLHHIQNFLLLLIVIYISQGPLYPQGTLFSQITLVLIFLISGFYLVKTLLQKNKTFFYTAHTGFLFLNIIGFIFTSAFLRPASIDGLKAVLLVALPFYPFYYFAQKGSLRDKHLILLFLVLIPISIMNFYYSRSVLLVGKSDDSFITNNAAYRFVFLLPFVFLFREKRVYAYLSLLVLFAFIIQGAKRGAAVAGFAAGFFVLLHLLTNVPKKNKLWGYMLALIGVAIVVIYSYNYYLSSEYLSTRLLRSIEEGDSSYRDVLYSSILNGWYNSENPLNLFFGYGFRGSTLLTPSGHVAHNDWLEALSNYGFVGVIMYLFVFVSMLHFTFKTNLSRENKYLMFSVLSIWIITTIISMNYTAESAIFQSIILAYMVGVHTKIQTM